MAHPLVKIYDLQEYLNSFPNNNFQLKYFKKLSRRPFLIDKARRIVVELIGTYNQAMMDKRLNKFKNKKMLYFLISKHERIEEHKDIIKKISDIPGPVKKRIDLTFSDLHKKEYNSFLKKCRDELNKNPPKSEIWFQEKIEKEPFFKKFKFTNNEILFGFIYDLFSSEYRVVIEVDGTWHDRMDQKSRDIEKEQLIVQKCWTIIRVKAYDESSYGLCIKELTNILNNTSKSRCDVIRKKLEAKMIKRHF